MNKFCKFSLKQRQSSLKDEFYISYILMTVYRNFLTQFSHVFRLDFTNLIMHSFPCNI